MAREQLARRQWLSFSIAGSVLGLSLALLLSGVFAWVGDVATPNKDQIVMWMVFPLWFAVLASAFAFRTPRACWGWLLLANVVAALALLAVRQVA